MEQVEDFKKPKFKLEQYFTPRDQTVELFSRAHLQFNAFKKKVVGDFCCGTGMFSIAAEFFKPTKTVAFDIDEDVIKEAWDNFDYFELENKVDLVQVDLSKTLDKDADVDKRLRKPYFDTIMMNPPFGTVEKGIDMKMLQAGYQALKPGGQMFSIHKLKKHKPELTRRYITKFCTEHFPECKLSFLWQFEFPLPKTYKHHKKELGKVDVIVIRLYKPETEAMLNLRKENLNKAFVKKTDEEI
jgi:rRNA N6-adenosine-methyltransferase METTL5